MCSQPAAEVCARGQKTPPVFGRACEMSAVQNRAPVDSERAPDPGHCRCVAIALQQKGNALGLDPRGLRRSTQCLPWVLECLVMSISPAPCSLERQRSSI